MHQQKGNFNGIDTLSYSTYGKFDSCSYLAGEVEARTIRNRPDINALLNNLVKEKVLSPFAANEKRKEAMENSECINFKKYSEGATYVPLEVALHLQRELSKQTKTNVIVDHRGQNLPDITIQIKVCWPTYIYPCQKMNRHGATHAKIPTFGTRQHPEKHKLKNLRHLSSLITGIESLWRIISSNNALRRSQWCGWMLVYLTQHCFPSLNRKQANNDPYKRCQINTTPRLADKIFTSQSIDSIEDLFRNVTEVLCLDHVAYSTQNISDVFTFKQMLENSIDVALHEVVIIDKYTESHHERLEDSYIVQGVKYKLCCLSRAWDLNEKQWSSETDRRHVDECFTAWWYQSRYDHTPIGVNRVSLVDSQPYVLGYARTANPDMRKLGIDFMSYIGNKNHIYCERHRIPLIASTKREGICSCGKQEWYCCSQLGCGTKLCKKCADGLDEDGVTYIKLNQEQDNETMQNNENEFISDTERVVSEEGFDSDGENLFINEEESLASDDDSTESHMLTRDDFDEFLTSSEGPDMPFNEIIEEESEFNNKPIPTTNSGEYAFEIEDERIVSGHYNDVVVSGNVIMNQCGTLLTRKKHQIKGSSLHKWFMERICAVNIGTSIPLLYPEAMLFPSIFYKMVPQNGSFCGAFPSALLTESISEYGFQSIPQHVRSRLSSAANTCGSDPRYTSYCFDKLTNLSANHQDTRVSIHRGFASAGDEFGGLGVRRQDDTSLHQSVDGTQNTKNLCASQPYHPMDYFITFSCNQKKYIGVKNIKNWVDNKEWAKHFTGWEQDLTEVEQMEIFKAMRQASAPLLCRNWQEVTKILIHYLRKSTSSPFKRALSIFARCEYQKDVGNLSHIHLILEVNWKVLNPEEKKYIKDLIRCSIFDIVRPNEIESLINEGVFECIEDHRDMMKDAERFLPHKCSSRCQACIAPGVFRCRKPNNLQMTTDNTKHVFKPLPNSLSDSCIERLVACGLGYQCALTGVFKSHHPFFNPKRHIPPTNPTNDMNMSPVEGRIFSVCRSMLNVQQLTECGGVNKYVNKYITKIDEQNFVIVNVDGQRNGALVTKSQFLHNTKVVSSKINEDKAKENMRGNDHPQGRAISLMEMYHHIFKYPEIYTDLNFVIIPTVPLELRKGTQVKMKSNGVVNDGAYVGSISHNVRQMLGLE
jgi:hypothetical protein